MKNIKRLLYSFVLTSFVLIGSINVFAAVPATGGAESAADKSMEALADCASMIKQNVELQDVKNESITESYIPEISESITGGASIETPTTPPEDIPVTPPREPVIIYVNTTWELESSKCNEEYVDCVITTNSDPDDAQAVLDSVSDTVDDIQGRYNYCNEVDFTFTYNITIEIEIPVCPEGQTENCDVEIEYELLSEEYSYSELFGSLYGAYGVNYLSTTKTGVGELFNAKNDALTNMPTTLENYMANNKSSVAAARGSGYVYEGSETDMRNLVYTSKEECMRAAREQIAKNIRHDLLAKGYSASNRSISYGCNRFEVPEDVWNNSGNVSYGNYKTNEKATKLYNNYSGRYSLMMAPNSTIAYLFPYSDIMTESTVFGENKEDVIWKDDWLPFLIEFKEKIVSVEATGAYKDVKIKYDNGSVDLYIQNLTNSESKYYGKNHFFPLNPGYGYSKFSAILSRPNGTFVYPYNDGSGFGFSVNTNQSAVFTSERQDAYGENLITGYCYSDIYMQRLFKIRERKALIAYAMESNSVFSEGEYVGLSALSNSSSSCEEKWRALFNIYAEGKTITDTSLSKDCGVELSARDTGVGVYDIDTGEQLINEGGSSIHPIYNTLTVRRLVTDKFGSIEEAFSDILNKRMVTVYDASNNPRNGIFTSKDTAGIIYFDNGTKPYDYSYELPDLKPQKMKTSGTASNWGIDVNGIYVLAQTMLPETYTRIVTVPLTTNTINNTTTTTRIISYYICVGQHNCDCEDINVLCECQDEIAGCAPTDECKENPNLPQCKGPDCTDPANANNPRCGCFDNIPGNCGCPDVDKENCEIWEPYPDFKPDPDCLENGEPCYPDDPGGITGEGSTEYFDRFYNPSSTLTN